MIQKCETRIYKKNWRKTITFEKHKRDIERREEGNHWVDIQTSCNKLDEQQNDEKYKTSL